MAVTVNGGIGFAPFAVHILSDVEGVLVTLGAESLAGSVDRVRIGT